MTLIAEAVRSSVRVPVRVVSDVSLHEDVRVPTDFEVDLVTLGNELAVFVSLTSWLMDDVPLVLLLREIVGERLSEGSDVWVGLTEVSGDLLQVRLAELDNVLEGDAPSADKDSLGVDDFEEVGCADGDRVPVGVPAACA